VEWNGFRGDGVIAGGILPLDVADLIPPVTICAR
jgi:hypothetical protein